MDTLFMCIGGIVVLTGLGLILIVIGGNKWDVEEYTIDTTDNRK